MNTHKKLTLAAAILVAAGVGAPSIAEETSADGQVIEEIVAVGRLRSSAAALIDERIEEEVVTDMLSAEAISRVGDSTVATALRRIPGLSLVNDKFVYVRGLGERYSTTLLNGTAVPSPDLTRNVIPLDVFPTSIVESLKVQKTYSSDMPAAFGGGSVDIRTKGIPSSFKYSLEIGSGYHDGTGGNVLTYRGGDDDDWGTDDGTRGLPGEIASALRTYRGDLSVQRIRDTFSKESGIPTTTVDAQLVNRQLAASLNRNLAIKTASPDPDLNLKGSIGTTIDLSDDIQAGFLVGASYKNQWRDADSLSRNFSFPDEEYERQNETTHSVAMTAHLDTGLRYGNDHHIATTNLFMRITDDEAAKIDFFNENRRVSDGQGFRKTRVKFEEREMEVHQIRGEHRWTDESRETLPWLNFLPKNDDMVLNWRYSESTAATHIPSEVEVLRDTTNDTSTGRVLTDPVALSSSAGDFRFTDLNDDVLNYGWDLSYPMFGQDLEWTVSGGYEHIRKVRTYQQRQFTLGALSVANGSVLDGTISEVFSNANILNPANDFVFDIAGSNAQSYIAAALTDAVFGKVDVTFNYAWRLSAGLRWEDYRQVAVDWNVVGYTQARPQVALDPDALGEGVFNNDQVYPSVSLTYMREGFWSETFQLRLGYSETVVRPDLRETTDAGYIDPITGASVIGKPGVTPSDVRNVDLRGEWFFGNGDSFTVSAYYKDIQRPIEFFEAAASDTNVAREIINAESAEIQGLEFEFLKSLASFGEWGQPFFLSGNLTLQDTEIDAGVEADAPTNMTRPMTGASEYVANLIVGFDSSDGMHAATIAYNVFGDRLYVAGRNGAPDGYEQPFHSLDFTYSWYPIDTLTLKFKVKNLLDESVVIERQGVTTFEEFPGLAAAIDLNWAL